MNKDLFKIDSDEVRRILSLHEERTKTQYLNIILEAEKNEYVLAGNYILNSTSMNIAQTNNSLRLYKGATFKKVGNELVAKTSWHYVDAISGKKALGPHDATVFGEDSAVASRGEIVYICSTGKFYSKTDPNNQFYDKSKGLTNNLSQLCQGRLGVYTKQKEGNFTVKAKGDIGVKFGANNISIMDGDEINYINKVARGLNKQGNYYINFKCPNVFNVEQNFGQRLQNKATPKNHTTLAFFQNNFCQAVKPKEFKSNDVVNKQPKSNFKAIYTIGQEHDLGNNVVVKPKDIIIKSFKYPDYAGIMRGNTAIAYFNCKTNTWSDSLLSDKKGLLTGTIKQKVCPQVLSSSVSTVSTSADTQTNNTDGTNTGGTNTGGTNTGGTNTGNLTRRQSRFIANTQTKINNVQKLLGVTPTGQLDTTQIDTLINKLKGQ